MQLLSKTLLFNLLLFTFLTTGVYSQDLYNEPLGSPVKIPMYLSGTFGELRSNHFHSGIDIKTQGREGLEVIAIDDGWISRIKISTGGYGKALYITHPNGLVSVYGHLKQFNDTIGKYVRNLQYSRENFEVETFPQKNELQVHKGEIIALSGNTGGSMGPHLHFEIRDATTQQAINPLLFKSLKIKDFYRPKILEMAVYPVDSTSLINGKADTLFIKVGGWGEKHRLNSNHVLTISGPISFGISTYDLMNEVPNKNGVYEIKLMEDTLQYFGLKQDKISFSTSRYINSLIDYSTYIKSKQRFVRTQVDTNNLLTNYLQVANNGIYRLKDSISHTLTWYVTDAYKNKSALSFVITRDTLLPTQPSKRKKTTAHFIKANAPYQFSSKNIEVSVPSNAFYQSFYFDFEEISPDSNIQENIYKLHNNKIPVQKRISIRVKPNHHFVTDSLLNKVYLAYSPDNKKYTYAGGKLKEGMLVASIRKLGYFKLQVDTISPTITPINLKQSNNYKLPKTLKIKIEDKQTGIKTYRASLNNQWILMEYETKKELLFYQVDEHLKKGENIFSLTITDQMDNETIFTTTITR